MIIDSLYFDFSKINHLLTDSRNLRHPESTLFFCLEGKGRAGTDFIPELYDKGVRNFVVPESYAPELDAVFIKSKQPLDTLQEIALSHRKKYNGTTIAVAGSNGKTVVKEWLFQILSKHHYTYRSPKSFNSQIGVPLSVWEIPLNSKFAVIEAGISEVNEMQKLEAIIKPQIGIFTNIGNAHQENFESLEQKAKEKLKLFDSCSDIVYCKDNELVSKLILELYPNKNLLAWSNKDCNAAFYFSVEKDAGEIQLITNGTESYTYNFPFTDIASYENIMHCIVAAIHLGINPENINIQDIEPVAMRLEQKEGINGCLLINDAYNSDILSLGIALDKLSQIAKTQDLKQTILLSDIEQSGISDDELYTQVAAMVKRKMPYQIIGIGEKLSQFSVNFDFCKNQFYSSTEEFLLHFNAEEFQSQVILFKGARSFEFERIIRLLEKRRHQTIMEIDLSALRSNFNYFKGLLKPETMIMGMVKAFAYGSGSIEVARTLEQQGCNYLAVAIADEGVELRNNGISLPILVMNPESNSFESMFKYGLQPAIYSFQELNAFLFRAKQSGVQDFPIHLKFDTGMHRLGFSKDDIPQLIDLLKEQNTLKAAGVFSHLAGADETQWDDFTNEQIALFTDICTQLENLLGYKLIKHILNSAGSERFTQHQMDMVRLGIGMYGVSHVGHRLEQIATLKASISQLHKVPGTETVGYGRKGRLERDSVIATIPIGYADGLRRAFGNGNSFVLIKGKKAPIVGNICMDLCMVDVTDIDAKEGDEVVLMGEGLTASDLAEKVGTIPYEILTSISLRVKRVYVE